MEKKPLANFIANKLSELLYGKVGGQIVEARIAPETLRNFHVKNPEDTKVTFFDNVEYCKHGDLWYVVARSREYGYVVGVTRDASVTIFNLTDKNKYLEYVAKEIYPLIV